MIEAVLLDVGGVLLLPEHDHSLAALARAGLDADGRDLNRLHYVGVSAMDAAAAETEQEALADYFAACAQDLCPDVALIEDVRREIEAAWLSLEWTNVLDESVEALRELSRTGVKVAIVSNSNGTVERKLREAGICQVGPGRGVDVAIVVDSHVVGITKPDPAIFGIALKALDATPGATVHVGDSKRSDVAGAKAAGIRPLHFDPYELCSDDDHEHVRSLRDVVRSIEASR